MLFELSGPTNAYQPSNVGKNPFAASFTSMVRYMGKPHQIFKTLAKVRFNFERYLVSKAFFRTSRQSEINPSLPFPILCPSVDGMQLQ